MKFYKKALLTLTAAGTMTACQGPAIPERFPKQGVVTGIDTNKKMYYLDMDGDGLTDKSLYLYYGYGNDEDRYFRNYIQVGDTLKYSTADTCTINMTAFSDWGPGRMVWMDSVNNRSLSDLKKIAQINQLRVATGQPKMR